MKRNLAAFMLALVLVLAGCGPEEEAGMSSSAGETEAAGTENGENRPEAQAESSQAESTGAEASAPETEEAGTEAPETEAEETPAEPDLASYVDTWWSDDRSCCLVVDAVEGDQITFHWNSSNRFDRMAGVEALTGTLEGNQVSFAFEDGWGNRGEGNLTLENGTIVFFAEITEPADGARWNAGGDYVLQREDPANWEYLFPDSDSRYLSREEVEALDTEELRLARNEIFARCGRRFTDPELSAYFKAKYWYIGAVDPEDFDQNLDQRLNEYERANAALIAEVEAER